MTDFDFLGLFKNEPTSKTLEPGELLFGKGDAATGMYVVRSGEVQIGDGNIVFETVTTGGMVGEMALIDNGPRSATVKATARTEVIAVDQKRFLAMIQQTPFFAIRVMTLLAQRLRAMNARTELA